MPLKRIKKNMERDGENAANQHYPSRLLKHGMVWKRDQLLRRQQNFALFYIENTCTCSWLVSCMQFNATFPALVISWWSETQTCFLAFSHQY